MSFDLKFFYLLNNLAGKNTIFDSFIIFLADFLQYFLIIAFLLLLFFLTYSRQQKIKIILTVFVSMIIARFGVVSLIRFFYHRIRPFTDHSVNQLITNNGFSFPSGHAALFFAMAMAIYFYPNREPNISNVASNKKWGILFFLAAILMGLSRIIAGVHYPSDIIGGAIIGILSAYLIFYFSKKLKI